MPFWNQNGIIGFPFWMIPFWFQKGTKNYKNFIKNISSKNMDFQLSKDVPTIFQSFLEQILGSDVVWSKMAKTAIFAIFGQNTSSYLGT